MSDIFKTDKFNAWAKEIANVGGEYYQSSDGLVSRWIGHDPASKKVIGVFESYYTNNDTGYGVVDYFEEDKWVGTFR